MDALQRYWLNLNTYARAWGLDDETARAYATLAIWEFMTTGRGALRIISGYRSEERQAQLRRRWDDGIRDGLATRPALSSAHSRGHAFDVEPDPSGETVWRWGAWASYLGLRWGGTFTDPDPNHFDSEANLWKA